MKAVDLLQEHFSCIPGILTYKPTRDWLSINWATCKSQILHQQHGEPLSFDYSRDHIILKIVDNNVHIFRVDSADRVLPDQPWKILNLCDENLIKEISRIIRYL